MMEAEMLQHLKHLHSTLSVINYSKFLHYFDPSSSTNPLLWWFLMKCIVVQPLEGAVKN